MAEAGNLPGPIVEESVKLNVPAQDAWELLIDTEAQQQWLGEGSAIPGEREIAVLNARGAAWRQGTVRAPDAHSRTLQLSIGTAPGWIDPIRTQVVIRVEPDSKDAKHKCRVVLTESLQAGATPTEMSNELIDYWIGALDRLKMLAESIAARRKVSQAVVVVHGIGEQVPGETLNRFVEAVVPEAARGQLRSKPDRISMSLELRRLSLGSYGNRPKTDFYEYYWAHQIRDTTPGQVVGWLGRLLRSRWSDVPRALRPGWLIGWLAGIAIAIGLVLLVSSVLATEGTLALLGALSLAISSALTIVSFLLVKSLGDAARYLSARPENVEARERIRLRGLEILERLHESKRYHRIVVVGHSLGSVIAYDLVTHLWARTHQDHLRPRKTQFGHNSGLHNYEGDDPAVAQDKQHAAWTEMRRNTQPWLITDLITVGSPLAHGELLMTRGKDPTGKRAPRNEEWRELRKRRELPTAPPERDEAEDKENGIRAFWYQARFTDRDGRTKRTFRYLHHAAPFAVVRWTNLYFPVRGFLFGDPIGGPIRKLFGTWINEVKLDPPQDWPWPSKLWLHSSYWRTADGDDSEPPTTPLGFVRAAMQLDCLEHLSKESAAHTPILYLDEPTL